MANQKKKPVIGVIGGSGVYDIDGLTHTSWQRVESSFGEPSDELLAACYRNAMELAEAQRLGIPVAAYLPGLLDRVPGIVGPRPGLALLLVTAGAGAQEAVFKVDVRLVRLLVTVKNAAGDLIGTLESRDFTVADNGVKQDIAVFEHQTTQPLSIALMIDISASTAKDLRYETVSVSKFLEALVREGNPDDAAALYKSKCVICHGQAAEKKFAATKADDELIQTILNSKRLIRNLKQK